MAGLRSPIRETRSIFRWVITSGLTRRLASELSAARTTRRPIAMITTRHPEFGVADGYEVQAEGVRHRLGSGEVIVGGKLGFTSAAMQKAMGVDHPNYGWLTDLMLLQDGEVDLGDLIHPKVEPEIAFLLDADLEPPITVDRVLAATRALMPCLEVVDSRYIGFRFAAADNIADNSSAGMVALGPRLRPNSLDLQTLGVALSQDGHLRYTARGAAALDHPAAAVAWMANACGSSGLHRGLQAGDVVLSGGLTPPLDLHDGTVVTAEFDRLGPVTIHACSTPST